MILIDSFGVAVEDFVARVAHTNVPILLCGETGSGKGALAELIHGASSRANGRFVRADCASIPDGLFEREMFGHTRGSFTDAKDSQPGLFEAAEGGTLFLDEVGELPLSVQPKMLSILDTVSVRRIGSTKSTRIDVRIIAATNRDLREMVQLKLFRSDLYHRLAFLKIQLPPLRERQFCIDQLSTQILAKLVKSGWVRRQVIPTLHPRTLERLQRYDWPGNVRELEHALAFAMIYFESDVILPQHLPPEMGERASLSRPANVQKLSSRYRTPDDPEVERFTVLSALETCEGNRSEAAKLLGMSRATLWIKLRGLHIERRPGTEQSRSECTPPESLRSASLQDGEQADLPVGSERT